jgi:DNA-binding GntR family transcriptional regulator
VLNLLAYHILGSHPSLSHDALKLFFRLLVEHDLRKPRALSHDELAKRYSLTPAAIQSAMSELCEAGVMEELGPTRATAVSGARVYRVRPEIWLAADEMSEAAREAREMRDREELLPPA